MKRDWNDRLRAGEQIDPDAPGELLEQAPLPEGDEGAAPVEDLRLPWRTVGSWGELDGQDWLNVEAPPRSWLLTDPYGDTGGKVLSRGVVGVFASAGGVGKTFALLELAVLVASGSTDDEHNRLWLDRLKVSGGGRVLFLAGEESADELRRRLFAVVRRLRAEPDGYTRKQDRPVWPVALKQRVRDRLVLVPTVGLPDLALLTVDGGGNMRPSARHAELVERLREGEAPWDLVIVDPMVRFAAGEIDKDNQAASALIGAFEAFVRAGAREGHPGPAVLVAHHTSKASRGDAYQEESTPSAEDVRGASALVDNARWAAVMKPKKGPAGREAVAFGVVKSNYGSKPGFDLLRDESGVLRVPTMAERMEWQDGLESEHERRGEKKEERRLAENRGKVNARAKAGMAAPAVKPEPL